MSTGIDGLRGTLERLGATVAERTEQVILDGIAVGVDRALAKVYDRIEAVTDERVPILERLTHEIDGLRSEPIIIDQPEAEPKKPAKKRGRPRKKAE